MNCSHCGAPLAAEHLPCAYCAARKRPDRRARSKRADVVVTLTFENRCHEEVDVFWLDYAGAAVLYRTLDPGESAKQETFETHAWELISESGQRLLFVAGAEHATVTFHPGASTPGT